MKIIIINSPKYGIKELKVDDDMFDYVNQWKWSAHKDHHTFYAERSERRKRLGQKTIYYKLHRVIMNTPEGMVVDHIDGDGLNCIRSNMRNCTYSENCKNKRSGINSSSKYLGVYQLKVGIYKYWQVNIINNGVPTYLGNFKNEDDAAKAYNEAATKYHGSFARLNVID